MIRNRTTRPGITLVEMMVAMALTLGIMLILTESFKMALDFVRGANSTGSMVYHLNGAGLVLNLDLKAEHFLPSDDRDFHGVKLSDERLDFTNWTERSAGFFRIVSTNPGLDLGGSADVNGFYVNNPSANHVLHFTSMLPATSQNHYIAVVNNVTYTSRAAEVAYFLVGPVGQTGGPNSQNLYNLVRRQRLLAATDEDTSNLQTALLTPGAAEVISVDAGGKLNTVATVSATANRFSVPALGSLPAPGWSSFPPLSTRYGEDIVLTNVLSFEVLADWSGGTAARGFGTNTEAPYDFLPGGGVFDTTSPPLKIRVKSLQITARVFDPAVKTARQNTWKIGM